MAYTGTTGNYLTLDSPCKNKKIVVIPLPIRMPNREIITSTHTALLSKPYLPIEALKAHIFRVLTNPCYQLELFSIMDTKQYYLTKNDSLSIKGMGKWWWKVDKIRFQIYTCSILPSVIIHWQSYKLLGNVFLGMYISVNQKAHMSINITHHAGSPINTGG